jgi:hypothetical protein
MTASAPGLTTELIHAELRTLRRGEALAHPGVVRSLSNEMQQLLLASQGSLTGQAEEIPRMVAALRRAIDALSPTERLHAQVEFGLLGEHDFPTLGRRQESLAAVLGCTVKTVRRTAGRALDTLAMVIATGDYPSPPRRVPATSGGMDEQGRRHADLARFWGIRAASRVDMVCSELPIDQRAATAQPGHLRYMRYGQFADLDALVYARVRLARTFPDATVHDFAPSEHYDADADTVLVLGPPDWNSKHREFLPDLPVRFLTGPDGPQIVITSGAGRVFPARITHGRVVSDLTMVSRLTIGHTTVFLLAGCLSLGTSGSAKCFLHEVRGPTNARYVTDRVGDQDFILVAETHRIGSITDTPDLSITPPLVLLTRTGHETFRPVPEHRSS